MKSKLEIYALAVCFAAVVCIVISAGIAGYSALEIIVPEITMSAYTYDKYQSNMPIGKVEHLALMIRIPLQGQRMKP